MATRPIFIVSDTGKFVKEVGIEFKWFPGLSVTQKQKSIEAMHTAANKQFKNIKILEISSKSKSELGINLSAFNLTFTTMKFNKCYSVETAFQSSKVFEFGGPYSDLLDKTSREAKKDHRLKISGRLISFKFFGTEWPLEPKTIFYDWLYINALVKNQELSSHILAYDAFTDIEFNPDKSLNCQARSAAIYVSLCRRGLLDNALASKDDFIRIYMGNEIHLEVKSEKQLDLLES